MSDSLFTFMYEKWDDKEIQDIADDPGAYVIAISDLITSSFHVLGFTTATNNLGEIYVQKYKDLDPTKKSANNTSAGNTTEIQERHAKIIAFFFVRIFQILGALLLVVKDIDFPQVDSQKETTIASRNFAKEAQLPRYRYQSGGDNEQNFPRSVALGPWEFLRRYLSPIDADFVSVYKTKYNVVLDKNKLYKFKGSDVLFFQYDMPTNVGKDTMVGANTQGNTQTLLLITAKDAKSSPTIYQIKLKVTDYIQEIRGYVSPYTDLTNKNNPTDSDRRTIMDRMPTQVSFKFMDPNNTRADAKGLQDATVGKENDRASGSIPKYRFQKGTNVPSVLALFGGIDDFSKVLELLTLVSVRDVNMDRDLSLFKVKTEDTSSSSGPGDRNVKPPKNEMLRSIYEAIKNKDAYRPHCIARALQLLDAGSIMDKNSKGETEICKFVVGKTNDSSFRTYKPLKSVGQLFGKINPSKLFHNSKVGKSVEEREQIRKHNELARAEYKNVEDILRAFVKEKATGDVAKLASLKSSGQASEADALSAAIDRLTKAFKIELEPGTEFDVVPLKRPAECDTLPEADRGKVKQGGPDFLAMKAVSQKLLAYHIKHVANIATFLKTIFNMKQRGDGSWAVEGPNVSILLAGFRVLDTITDQARKLLIDYYTGCESLYQEGLQVWKDSTKAKAVPLVSAMAAPAPAVQGVSAMAAPAPAVQGVSAAPGPAPAVQGVSAAPGPVAVSMGPAK